MPSSEPAISFSQIRFNSGVVIDLSATGLVIFVGPNNVGKTTSIFELRNRLITGFLTHNQPNVVFEGVEFRTMDDATIERWLKRHEDNRYSPPATQPELVRYRNSGYKVDLPRSVALQQTKDLAPNNRIAPLLFSDGAGIPFEGPTPDLYSNDGADTPNRQFEALVSDRNLRKRVSSISETVFGTPIGINTAGSKAALHYGQVPKGLTISASPKKREELRAVPLLQTQGQGVTAFMTQALSIELGNEPLVFLDEPEAHLHPPQARKAGAFVAARASRSQVFIATHDLEYLIGLLESNQTATIVRLDRTGDMQSVNVVNQETLTHLWTDTLVRYSNVLGGLMHKGVVICESDSDCRFFEVALDYYRSDQPAHDLQFVYTGGKGALPKLSEAAT